MTTSDLSRRYPGAGPRTKCLLRSGVVLAAIIFMIALAAREALAIEISFRSFSG